MTNYREILRLYHQGFSCRKISASLSYSRNTVSKIIKQVKKFDLKLPLSESMDNEKIVNLLFPKEKSKSTYKELNQAIKRKLSEFNRPFQKKEGCRKSIFNSEEQGLLIPLPAQPYEISSWRKYTVPFNYHISLYNMYYSVPYEYIGYYVDVRLTSKVIEVFYKDCRIASHVRLSGKSGQYQTNPDHMPQKHQRYQQWNAESLIAWAEDIGKQTTIVVKSILSACSVEQQGYRVCILLLKLADKYSVQRLENACTRALSYTPTPGYKNVSAEKWLNFCRHYALLNRNIHLW